jgi:hypothetical protein
MSDSWTDSRLAGLPKSLVKKLLPGTYDRLRDVREAARGRSAHLEREAAVALWNNALYRVIGKIIAESGVYVRRGPFAGMLFWPVGRPGSWAGGQAPSLLGLYELELHEVLEAVIARKPRLVVDIGAAEGYYAVGMALRLPEARVLAFDIDPMGRHLCEASARINGVADRMVVAGECTTETLRTLTSEPAFVMLDCEGAELDLLRPDLVSGLGLCEILVELHDVFRPGLSDELLPRFSRTHDIRLIDTVPRVPGQYRDLGFLTDAEQAIALDERRPRPMRWAHMTPRASTERSRNIGA